MWSLTKSLRKYWGAWLGMITLLAGATGQMWISRHALPLEPLKKQSLVLLDSQDRWLHVRVVDGNYRIEPQGRVSPIYESLLLAYEDRRFWQHGGVDPFAVGRAAIGNLLNASVQSGASTITMQVARLLRPHARSLAGKVEQAAGALWLEQHFTKLEILKAYYTLAPFGANIQGVELGARHWFGKSPKNLSLAEAALLIALPQRPALHRPDLHPERAKEARNRVLRKGFESGLINFSAYQDARESPLPRRPYAFEQLNHHLADRAQKKGLSGYVRTTLNLDLQRDVNRRVAAQHLATNENLSVLITRENGAVIALAGSQDYFDRDRAGAVDFSTRARSPGSTLKPLIYGLAESAGVLRYEHIFRDQPIDFGAYRPDNFDRRNRGDTSFADALIRSDNRGAVEALQRLGVERFVGQMAQAGIALSGEIGLPIAAGGIGVRLEDLAQGYTALLNQGKVHNIRWRRDETLSTYNWMEPDAALRTNHQLRQTSLPEGRARSQTLKHWALKTGTGPRGSDTLAMLYNKNYLISAWIGSPENDALKANTGLRRAAPLALAIADLLPKTGPVASVSTGPAQKNTTWIQKPMKLVFPVDESELALAPGRNTIRPQISDAKYPLNATLNGRHLQILNGPSDHIKFPTPGHWKLVLSDSMARQVTAKIQVWF